MSNATLERASNMTIDTEKRFARLERLGLVRFQVLPDEHFDPADACACGAPECRAEEIARRDGAWGTVGEYRNGHGWEHGGSCWGHVGYRDPGDAKENPYVTDVKAETITQLREAIRSRCRCCKGTGKGACHA